MLSSALIISPFQPWCGVFSFSLTFAEQSLVNSPPHPPVLLLTRSLFIYSFFYFSRGRHYSRGSIRLHGEVGFYHMTRFLAHRPSASKVVKTQPRITFFTRRRIRRIKAVSDFHHWSVVYHPFGKSLLMLFGCILQCGAKHCSVQNKK